MLDRFRTFLADFGDNPDRPASFGPNDHRLAAAALLIHVLNIDGQPAPAEIEKLRAVLKSQFDLDDRAAEALIAAGNAADRDAVDLYRFTSALNRSLDEQGRGKIVEMMWEIVYADGGRSEFEDNVVWRAADLLGIPARERIASRQRVAARSKAGG